ncbi:hypothetical protein [Streptomyces antibioticus]|uniref:hypothetical protein n=1 Tax=Streptomyces antibioticus TaxID=1890 RepID=UPI002258DC7B|nr:hypothetical protein [Streptomyces antibioticus]MCX4742778.1 hypothetical protein [Streptomyces antibioticus]
MDDEATLIASFESLRKRDGLTVEKLRDERHARLLVMLGAEEKAEEGFERLTDLVLSLRDSFITRSVRNALVIGDDIQTRGGLEERRAWAVDRNLGKSALIPRDRRTHCRYEARGFKELARSIIRQHTQRSLYEVTPSLMNEFLREYRAQREKRQPDWDAMVKEVDEQMRQAGRFGQYAFVVFGVFGLVFFSFLISRPYASTYEKLFAAVAMIAVELLFMVGIIDMGRKSERSSTIIEGARKLIRETTLWRRKGIDD